MGAYDAFLSGKLQDYELPQEEIDKAEAVLKGYPPIG
jgi:hypothetical protein